MLPMRQADHRWNAAVSFIGLRLMVVVVVVFKEANYNGEEPREWFLLWSVSRRGPEQRRISDAVRAHSAMSKDHPTTARNLCSHLICTLFDEQAKQTTPTTSTIMKR